MGNVSHDIGPDSTELIDENINVVGCNFGSLVPSRQELMMGNGRRDRIVEVGALKCGETIEDTGGVFTGFDVLKVDLEELLDGRPLSAMGSLKETDKGWDFGRATRGGVDEGPRRGGGGAASEHAIELLTAGSHRGCALGSGGGGGGGGRSELRDGGGGPGRGGLVGRGHLGLRGPEGRL